MSGTAMISQKTPDVTGPMAKILSEVRPAAWRAR